MIDPIGIFEHAGELIFIAVENVLQGFHCEDLHGAFRDRVLVAQVAHQDLHQTHLWRHNVGTLNLQQLRKTALSPLLIRLILVVNRLADVVDDLVRFVDRLDVLPRMHGFLSAHRQSNIARDSEGILI